MTRDKQRVSYICEPCNFTTFNKTDYERHLSRRKHHENVKYYEKTIPKLCAQSGKEVYNKWCGPAHI